MFELVPFGRRKSGLQKNTDPFGFESLFENFLNDRIFPSLYANSSQMKVDIKESEKEYTVEAEIPGATKDEIKLQLDDEKLTISFEKTEQKDEEKENYIRRERGYSSITRSFALPDIIAEDIKAKFDNGILTITLPKKQNTTKPGKQINIE